jgi:hypothetical protein
MVYFEQESEAAVDKVGTNDGDKSMTDECDKTGDELGLAETEPFGGGMRSLVGARIFLLAGFSATPPQKVLVTIFLAGHTVTR